MPVVEDEKLLSLFPHRAENILVDKVDCPLVPGGMKGTAWLRLTRGDGTGREIFTYKTDGAEYLLSPVACEFIALAGICVIKPDLSEDEICFFSTISNVEFTGRVRINGRLTASVERLKDRGPFKRFAGAVSDDTGELAHGDTMAYAVKTGTGGADIPGKAGQPPETPMDEPVNKALLFPDKPAAMVFADAVTDRDADSMTITTRFIYPEDHPLTKGHFPGNPVMMGVAQWIAVEDAARLLAAAAGGLNGRHTFAAELVRPDGTLVADVKKLVLDFSEPVPETCSLSRISFRGMVRPGEPVYVRVSRGKEE
ncbi:MAG: hypothetical protein JW909_08830 [Planctomycetes bacterium]|nr:hypothetical protein [Planctomycetota bacterium]